MQTKKIKIFIIAGEVSGDVLGARIISEMRNYADFIGIGGDNMISAGLQPLFPMSDLSVMGIFEVLAHAKTLTHRIRQTVDEIIKSRPDIVLTIDSPGFAKSVIKRLKKSQLGKHLIQNGLRFHHFVAPQVWAWRAKRAKKFAKTFDKLYAFFDFEVPYFTKYGLDTIATGHPTADKLLGKYDKPKSSEKIITLIPGSRISEVKKLLPLFHQVINMLHCCGYTGYKFVMPTVETTDVYVRNQIKTWEIRPKIVASDTRYDWYARTHIAIAASGTVSAELAMLHIPAIIVYKMNPLTTWIGRHLIKVKWVSLVNILLNHGVYPEYLGSSATAENIVNAFCRLTIPSVRSKMISKLEQADHLWRSDNHGCISTIADDIIQSTKK